MSRGNITPMVYARDIIDPKFGTQLVNFIDCYLKLKYSKEQLTEEEVQVIDAFYPNFNQTILQRFSAKDKVISFLKVNRWFNFLLNLNISK